MQIRINEDSLSNNESDLLKDEHDSLVLKYQLIQKMSVSKGSSPFIQKSSENQQNSTIYENEEQRKEQSSQNIWKKIRKLFSRWLVSTEKRSIWLQGKVFPQSYEKNQVSIGKYTLFNFLPLSTWNIFTNFSNFFLLIIAFSQFFYDLKVGFLYSYISPPIAFFTFLLIREAYDQMRRKQTDQEQTFGTYKVLVRSENNGYDYKEVHASDLRVGNIIELQKGSIAPADLIILFANGQILVKTDQFDGKTMLVTKRSIQCLQQEVFKRDNDIKVIGTIDARIDLPAPSEKSQEFTANFISDIGSEEIKEQNAMWTNCVLQSGCILGLIAYCGRETKSQMGSGIQRHKMAKLDLEVSFLTKVLCAVLICYSILIILIKGNLISTSSVFIDLVRFFVLLSCVIPASLKINLEICRVIYSIKINTDNDLQGVQLRDQNIPEELGCIHYLLADKTGTLTENVMTFAKICMDQSTYTEDNLMEMESIIINQCMRYSEPIANYLPTEQRKQKRPKEEVFRDLITAITICHSVAPAKPGSCIYLGESQEEVTLVKLGEQLGMKLLSRNEEEIKLQNCREKIDQFKILDIFPFTSKTKKMVIIVQHVESSKIIMYAKGAAQEIQLLLEDPLAFQFVEEESSNLSNEGLRVLVFAQKLIHPEDYFKWKNKIENSNNIFNNNNNINKSNNKNINNETNNSNEDSKNESTNHNNNTFNKNNSNNNTNINNNNHNHNNTTNNNNNNNNNNTRNNTSHNKNNNNFYNNSFQELDQGKDKRAISQQSYSIEFDMEFLGITGLMDRLREDVPNTIKKLLVAGISVWIATGDSMEQAMNTAILAGIKKNDQYFHLVKGVCDDIDIKAKLEYIHGDKNSKKSILVIDGESLKVAVQVAEQQFVKVCTRAASVLFCKCTATQKKLVVDLIKKYTSYRIAAIGDGANDVGMIRSAHLGIGLSSTMDISAAQKVADICIPEFYCLNKLLLWHGGQNYKRSVAVCSFVLQRGLVIAFIEFIFVGVFYTISLQIFNAQLLICYSSIFTIFPVLTIVLTQDVDFDICMKFPQIYKSAQKGRSLNLRTFFSWLWKAIFQATAIMMLIFTWFQREYFLNIETYVFFVMILSEYLTLFVKLPSLKKLNWMLITFMGISFLFYLIILLFLRSQFDIGSIWAIKSVGPLLGIAFISWVPLYGINLLRIKIDPTEDERILKNALGPQIVREQ